MAIDFPDSPTTGQVYQVNGRSWVYQGNVWTLSPSEDTTILRSGLSDAKGDLIVGTADNAFTRVPVGTNGQTLVADSTTESGVAWSNTIPTFIVDNKGDLIVASGDDTVVRLPVGTDGQALIADSAQTSGLAWGNVTSSGDSDQIVLAVRMFS